MSRLLDEALFDSHDDQRVKDIEANAKAMLPDHQAVEADLWYLRAARQREARRIAQAAALERTYHASAGWLA